MNDWLGSVLDYMAGDLFRYKGIMAIENVDQQFVFQVILAVHLPASLLISPTCAPQPLEKALS